MDLKSFIQDMMADMHNQCDEAMEGVTDEYFNWKPPGTTNPIRALLIHMAGAEDDFIQVAIQRRLPCWEVQDWGRKIGVDIPPMPDRGWKEFTTDRVRIAPVQAYVQTVRAATSAYLAQLTDDELDRQVYLFGQESTVTGALKLLIVHGICHVGEIATIKGMLGHKGFKY
jgi:hypothetical protein